MVHFVIEEIREAVQEMKEAEQRKAKELEQEKNKNQAKPSLLKPPRASAIPSTSTTPEPEYVEMVSEIL